MSSIDWRGLFDSQRIQFRARGKNVGRGEIAICCPLCGTDTGYHLGINETTGAFFCLRDNRHAGRSIRFLLSRLGISSDRIDALVRTYGNGSNRHVFERPSIVTPTDQLQQQWDRFTLADNHPPTLSYLLSRGFPAPHLVAQTYDLRYAPDGVWDKRLLIPYRTFKDGATAGIATWTGRSIRSGDELRYKAADGHGDGHCYLARPARRTVIIFEGQIDALKVAVAADKLDVCTMALCGKQLNASKILRIKSYCAEAENIYLCLDNSDDVNTAQERQMIDELSAGLNKIVARLQLDINYKDAGEMPLSSIHQWLCLNNLK